MARGRPVVTEAPLRLNVSLPQGLTIREAAARIKVGKTALYAALGEASEDALDHSTGFRLRSREPELTSLRAIRPPQPLRLVTSSTQPSPQRVRPGSALENPVFPEG